METYRLGTTLTIKWRLKDSDDQPFSLSGYDFTLQYRTGRGVNTAQVTTSQEEYGEKTDNVLKWTFSGTKQQYAGAYDLLLTVRSNGKVVCKQVYNNAFYLSRSEVFEPGDTTSATVELSSTAEWYIFGDKDAYVENTKAQLIGDSGDDSTKNTIYGAKAYANELSEKAKEEEAAARTEADNSLQEKITSETTSRLTADEQLTQKIQELSSDLKTETLERENEEAALLSKIQTESQERQAGIAQLVGDPSDDSTKNTIYGAKAYTDKSVAGASILLSESEYTALTEKDPNKLYLVYENEI